MTSRRLLTPVAKALLDAADYIEQNGHCKHSYHEHVVGGGNVPPRACAIGALRMFADNDVRDEAETRIKKHIGSDYIYRWNDRPERTAEEVVSTMREAAIT